MKSRVEPYKIAWLAYVLVVPQLIVTLIFFLWPAVQTLWQSMLVQDPFGLSVDFVWFENFQHLYNDPSYFESVKKTIFFSTMVTGLGIILALFFAALTNHVTRGAKWYQNIFIWPYAIAPAIAAVLWGFLFSPSIGIITHFLAKIGIVWDHAINGDQAMTLVIVASIWKQISYNFLFFLAALKAIPKSLLEAAAIDGAGPIKRFFSIALPLISPTTFFLVVINLIYAFFDTFAIIDATTEGGPSKATETLVYRVYQDGFKSLDLGGSATQSVILMALVIGLTIIQFRYIERKVNYV
ncbi:sn-glycerol-3-phosphate ABC transporter permease [Gammaproteobacteria bacterium]|nr:sn-glycerol-3-phosphate ABC transporter permease [Gammaproteobacteria bacterium]